MGINTAMENDYANAIRGLFPQGEYWDRQFEDPESDVNLFCKAKAPEIIRCRNRMRDLLEESHYQTAIETIGDWERVMLGYMNVQLPIEKRREILSSNNVQNINREAINNIALIYGLTITDIQFPYRPAFFGFSRFGIDSIASPAAWQTIVFNISTHGKDDQITLFEAHINNVLLANYIPHFIYNGGKL
jgi:hypothetical protein